MPPPRRKIAHSGVRSDQGATRQDEKNGSLSPYIKDERLCAFPHNPHLTCDERIAVEDVGGLELS